ncbi:LCP family glycopolymer transferase [Vagococcus zengguangii]|uniref:Transcriptional regulator n=1 Tax=Vagococcus zengguangii TaxID=2571750 RepID=A0A4D7CV38_9ENTE|nr:LCP family protein [Vagococcus zengguangii]QCI87002.1 transcriptional regulator [Vagococcus zengguangii]
MSRSSRHNQPTKKAKKSSSFGKKLLKTILAILLLLILALGGMAAKVYFDAKNTASDIHKPIDRDVSELRDKPAQTKKGDPISILLLGIDTGDLGRVEQGRSDTMMIATLNPNTKKSTLVSIPRDTYTEIIGHDTVDKLNHAYAFGGPEMSMLSVENLLQIPVDHYVAVDMGGLKEVVDIVGGIDVDNDIEFTQDNYSFPIGVNHMNGEQTLSYIRMRYDDPEGDYGRQKRQRKVVSAILNQALSLNTLTNYNDILKLLQNSVSTDLTWDQLLDVQSKYTKAFGTTQSDQLQGTGDMIGGVSYQIISDDELARVRGILKEQLEME